MNKGIFSGINSDAWKNYKPTMLCANNGAVTDPVLSDVDGRYQYGRYIILDKQIVIAQIQLAFIGTFSIGSGGAYVFSLPFPAQRWTGPGVACPIPIGQGLSYLSFGNPAANIPAIPTLADPFTSLNGQEDSYFQAYAPYILDWGSFTLTGSTSTATVSHNAGFAFDARDIDITFGAASTNNSTPHRITNITSTTFDITFRANFSGSSTTHYYKIRAEPPTGQIGALLGPNTPWDWSQCTAIGPFGNFFFQLAYQAKL